MRWRRSSEQACCQQWPWRDLECNCDCGRIDLACSLVGFRTGGRPTFLARKKVGKETHPAFRGPSGCPPCPNAQQVTSQTRPAGSDSEVTYSADHPDDSARQRDWGRANCYGRTFKFRCSRRRCARPGDETHPKGTPGVPSKAPIDKHRGRGNGLRCLSPKGELAKHAATGVWRLGIAAGDATVGCASLPTFLHKQESRSPAGARPGQGKPGTATTPAANKKPGTRPGSSFR